VAHELLGLFEDVVGVDQDLADFGVEVVADGADDQAGFLVDQEGAASGPWPRRRWRSTAAAGS
jgi:hypothetical protein